MSEWISVKERLPEENTNVLVCNADGVSLDEREPVIAYRECDDFWSVAWWDYVQCASPIVTHWMLLPEPPEAVK